MSSPVLCPVAGRVVGAGGFVVTDLAEVGVVVRIVGIGDGGGALAGAGGGDISATAVERRSFDGLRRAVFNRRAFRGCRWNVIRAGRFVDLATGGHASAITETDDVGVEIAAASRARARGRRSDTLNALAFAGGMAGVAAFILSARGTGGVL